MGSSFLFSMSPSEADRMIQTGIVVQFGWENTSAARSLSAAAWRTTVQTYRFIIGANMLMPLFVQTNNSSPYRKRNAAGPSRRRL